MANATASPPALFCTGCVFQDGDACAAGKLFGPMETVSDCTHRILPAEARAAATASGSPSANAAPESPATDETGNPPTSPDSTDAGDTPAEMD